MRAAKALELCRGVYGFPSNASSSLYLAARIPNSNQIRCLSGATECDTKVPDKIPEIPTSLKSSTLGNLKRGRGGRSSFSGIVATVFGASGFVGRHLVNQLGKIGSQIIVAHRCDPYDVKDLKLMGDLGQVLFQYVDVRDEAAIRKSIKYSNVVINLIGREYETKCFKFKDVHVDAPRRLARLSREAGVERFIHFSALNASPDPEKIYMKKGSQFMISKAQGEQAVREEFPNAIIFRPSDIFGSEDRFLNYYRWWYRRNWYYFPLYKSGEECIKQPVYVGDVARGVVNAITDPDAPGKIFEAVGPRRYILGELVDYLFEVLRRSPDLWGYTRGPMDPFTRLKMFVADNFRVLDPRMGKERVEREHISDRRLPGCLGLDDLGISPLRTIETYAPWHLIPYRKFNEYSDEYGEFPDPLEPRFMPDEKQTELWKLYNPQAASASLR